MGFAMVLLGLTASATLKYGLGRAAISQNWASKYAENPRISKAGDNVTTNLGKSLYMARFISAVRIPFYIASGFFKVNIAKFLLFVRVQPRYIWALLLAYFMFLAKWLGIN